MSLSLAGALFLLITCVFVPWAAIRNARRARGLTTMPTRRQHLLSVAITQGFLLVLALLTARHDWIELFPRPHFAPGGVLAAIALVALTLGTLPLRWSWRGEAEKKRLLWMLPGKITDLWRWTGIALTAGIVEEIVYRGVMFTILMCLSGSWWLSVLVCVTVFGLAHFVQGARTTAIIALISVGMHAVVWLTGDLYTAMALHFIYDLLAGIMLLRLARRDGLI